MEVLYRNIYRRQKEKWSQKNGIELLASSFLLFFLLIFGGCRRSIPTVSLGIEDFYQVERMKMLFLEPALTGKAYKWSMKRADGSDSIISTRKDLAFISAEPGLYTLSFEIIDPINPLLFHTSVKVVKELVEYSRYIDNVLEYCPAPGQFVNELPMYEEGDDAGVMAIKASEAIRGTNDQIISLGGYGGYVTFSFDHVVMNQKGKDFIIKGNAFYAKDPETGAIQGGSSEPGIVMVAFDTNGNGRPDNAEWYELVGSEHAKPSVVRNYSITYFRPQPDHQPQPGEDPHITDATYIRWIDNQGRRGYIQRNQFHTQEYYPRWLPDEECSFSGTLLPSNATKKIVDGEIHYTLHPYEWGYVDNHPSEYPELSSFDISDAIDAEGRAVHLPGVHWIRVYTALNQQSGWIGETSTEISQAIDLNLQNE